MNTPNSSRKHHYVSRFLLKNFGVDSSRNPDILVYDKKFHVGAIKKAKNIGYQVNFNQVTPGWMEEPEKWFGRVENEAAPALQKIIETKTLTEETLARVLHYLFVLFGRNPTMRALMPDADKLAADFIDKVRNNSGFAKSELKRWGHPCDPLTVRILQMSAWNTCKKLEFVTSQDIYIDAEVRCLAKNLSIWGNRIWSLRYTNPKTGYLISSDVPVSVVPSRAHGGGRRSVGIGSPNTEIIIPIHKTLFLMGENKVQIEKNGVRFAPLAFPLSEQNVGQANLIRLAHCSKQIYSPAKEFKINNKRGETIVFKIPTKKHATPK